MKNTGHSATDARNATPGHDGIHDCCELRDADEEPLERVGQFLEVAQRGGFEADGTVVGLGSRRTTTKIAAPTTSESSCTGDRSVAGQFGSVMSMSGTGEVSSRSSIAVTA